METPLIHVGNAPGSTPLVDDIMRILDASVDNETKREALRVLGSAAGPSYVTISGNTVFRQPEKK